MPSGHGGTRQGLTELRRILDAERHRIRRHLIHYGQCLLHEHCLAHRFHRFGERLGENLMANTLATVIGYRRLLCLLHRDLHRHRLPFVPAALPGQAPAVTRQHEERDEDA